MGRAILAGLLLLSPFLVSAQVTDDVRETLFPVVQQALAEANDAQANILAPVSYAAASEQYRRAEAMLNSGGSISSIRSHLDEATRLFRESTAATEIARVTLPDAIEARSDAENAEADSFAAEQWRDAEVTFARATRQLEEGKLNSARRAGEDAESAYRNAELIAIKANYLDETRSLLEEARDLNAKRYAPKTLAKSQALLDQAEQGLEQDRYDTDEPRSLAQDAKYEARHAIYLSQLGKRFRDGDLTLEDTQLEWEAAVRKIGDQLDLRVDFADGPEDAAAFIVAELEEANREWEESKQLVAAMSSEAESLELVRRLSEAQQKLTAQIQSVEAMFPADQAIVVRQADDVIIRMIGLNFDSGEATIKTEHYPLLQALREALETFPDHPVVIEGHTDSFGSDEFNLQLSEKRAQAVEAYLKSLPGFASARISSQGFGETRPAANNETEEGRKKNRRIDVVIEGAAALDPM